MSNRSMVEINHDLADFGDLDWVRAFARYMSSGDPKDLPAGVTFFSRRHHSDPCPLGEPPFGWSNREAPHGSLSGSNPVRPAVGPGTKPIESVSPKPAEPEKKGNGSGGDFGGLHPFVQGLLKTLPEPESEWPAAARVKWLQTAANIFDLIYTGDGGGISVRMDDGDLVNPQQEREWAKKILQDED